MNYLLIAGCRDFDDAETFDRVVREYLGGDEAGTVIVEGGAKGVDTLAREYAEKNGMTYVEMAADWKKYGRAAGPKRNEAMTKYIFDMNGAACLFRSGTQTKGGFWNERRGGALLLRPGEKHRVPENKLQLPAGTRGRRDLRGDI